MADDQSRDAVLQLLVAPLRVMEALQALTLCRLINHDWKAAVDRLVVPDVVPDYYFHPTTQQLHPVRAAINGLPVQRRAVITARICSIWPASAQLVELSIGQRLPNGDALSMTGADLAAAAQRLPNLGFLKANLLVEDAHRQGSAVTAALRGLRNLRTAELVFCIPDLQNKGENLEIWPTISGMGELRELRCTAPCVNDDMDAIERAGLHLDLSECPKLLEVTLGGVLSTYNFMPDYGVPVYSCVPEGPNFGRGCPNLKFFSIESERPGEVLGAAGWFFHQDFCPSQWVLGIFNGHTSVVDWAPGEFWQPIVKHILPLPGLERLVLQVEEDAEQIQESLELFAELEPELNVNEVKAAVVLEDTDGNVVPWVPWEEAADDDDGGEGEEDDE